MTTTWRRRLWLAALLVYVVIGAVDFSVRLFEDRQPGERFHPANVIVAFAAGLFWPADIVARLLGAR